MDDDLVFASYHQVHLAPLGSSPVFAGGDPSALIVTDVSGSLIITTGIADGPVVMTFQEGAGPLGSLPTAPPAGWEMLAEVSVDIAEPLLVSSPTWAPVREPVIDPARPGLHRVRVLARGRGAEYDASVTEASEEFSVAYWREERPTPPLVLGADRLTIRNGS